MGLTMKITGDCSFLVFNSYFLFHLESQRKKLTCLLLLFINCLIFTKKAGGEKKVDLQMPIRLTIMKPLTSICFSIYSVLVEHCDSWIKHFHPCLGLHSLPTVMCACMCSNSTLTWQKAYTKSDTLKLKRPCCVSHG